MNSSLCIAWTLTVLLAPAFSESAGQVPSETLASLKTEHEAAREELSKAQKPGATEAEVKRAVERFSRSVGDLGRRAVALAKKHPGTPDAIEALLWAHSAATENAPDLVGTIYDILADGYLNSEAILPLCRFAWFDAAKGTHAEEFLRYAIQRSENIKVRGLCCYSLGRHQLVLATLVRGLNDPVRGAILARRTERLDQASKRRLKTLDADKLEHEAEACFDRTAKEFGDVRPMGQDDEPLRELAAGMLFQMHHLSIGRTAPEIEGEDIDGKPMKLSDFRGKVVLVSFWATWCGPCMELLPRERGLVEKMKARPFVLVGVNGDENRESAKTASAKEGISWRSFWTGGPRRGIPVQWGVSAWPMIYVIDGSGVIRDNGLVYFHELESSTPDKMIETLVADAEKASKK